MLLLAVSLWLKNKQLILAVLSAGFRRSSSSNDVCQAELGEGSSPGPVQWAQTFGTAAFLSALNATAFINISSGAIPLSSKDILAVIVSAVVSWSSLAPNLLPRTSFRCYL